MCMRMSMWTKYCKSAYILALTKGTYTICNIVEYTYVCVLFAGYKIIFFTFMWMWCNGKINIGKERIVIKVFFFYWLA